jgi:hypothetical protein
MSRLALAALLVVAASLPAHADSPAVLAAEPPAANLPAPSISAHITSPATTAKLAGSLPKFTPRPAPAENSAPLPADLRETDRPRNTIVRLPAALLPEQHAPATHTADPHATDSPPEGVLRLPRYEVRDRRVPALKNRELLTPEGKIDLQFKKHPGLKIGNLFGLNRGIAAAMAAEDDAYERRLELQDLLAFQNLAESLPPPQTDADSPAPAAAAAPMPISVTK